jgi:TonB family protein
MARKEKLGRFVLLEEVEAGSFGVYHRAAKLGAAGLERLVSLLRLRPALSSHPEAASRLLDEVKIAAQMQSPTAVKVYGIGKVEGSYYVSQELIEGKSLRAILARCRQEAFPFAVDHALLIASKVCSMLEAVHARKDAEGAPYFHGFLNPGGILVSYEGDVRVRGFGLWPARVREVTPPDPEESRYLAPEQRRETGVARSDLFAVGAILFETLTAQPFAVDGADLDARLGQARLVAPGEDEAGLPKPIAEILRRSLAATPDARFADAAEMRKALDAILFSGDFAPTTFNLAFFLHSLFRQDIGREEKQLKQDGEASYQEYLEPPAPAAPVAASPPPPAPLAAEPAGPPQPAPVPDTTPPAPAAAARPATPPRDASVSRPPAELAFQAQRPAPRAPIGVIAVVVVAVIAAAGAWYFMARRPAPASSAAAPPTVATPLPDASAAARVKELEEKVRALEAERTAAGTKAADDARRKLEKQAAATGKTVDPAALQKAQEEARRKAQAEQEQRIQGEKRRLEEEEKRAQQARLAEQNRAAEEAAARAAAAATPSPPPTTVAAASPPPPTPPPPQPTAQQPPQATRPGALVSLTDPGVIAPVVERTPPMPYPPIALRQRVEGTVELSVLVDERGQVIEAKVVTPAGGRVGLNEAALENARRRRYRPATKDGVPVRVWVPVRVKFELPR